MEIQLTPPSLVMIIAREEQASNRIHAALGEDDLAGHSQPGEIARRLQEGRVAAVDATAMDQTGRSKLRYLAKAFHAETVAIAATTAGNSNQQQRRELEKALKGIRNEGFTQAHILQPEDLEQPVTLAIQRQRSDKRDLTGPFDIIGDVHGCFEELNELLHKLGYREDTGEERAFRHPEGRTAVFLGDLTDRGPDSPGVLRVIMSMAKAGTALSVMGNHDNKLMRHLMGNKVTIADGLRETLDQMEDDTDPEGLKAGTVEFLKDMPHHLWLDGGNLVAVHAGIQEDIINRNTAEIREFCYYGDMRWDQSRPGYRMRMDWTGEYEGEALVTYGHMVVEAPLWIGNTVGLETGCVFGGSLTALRYPEMETVSIKSGFDWNDKNWEM